MSRAIQALSYCKHPQSAPKATVCPCSYMKNGLLGACTKEGEPCLWEKGFQTVADYLKEGEGIFCGRINRSETLQVAYPQLYSVTCDWKDKTVRGSGLYSPHARVSASLVKCHFWLHVYSAPSICLFLIQIMPKSTAKAMRDGERDKGWREADGRELGHGKAAWPPAFGKSLPARQLKDCSESSSECFQHSAHE